MTGKLHELIPFFWYFAGSICFAVGTLVVIIRTLRGE